MPVTNGHEAGRVPFIGRKSLLRKLRGILSEGTSRIILLEGDAGIGKTAVLERIAQLADWSAIVSLPLFDFYDTHFHSSQALEKAIADALDPAAQGVFGDYRQRRLREPQADLWPEFLAGYRRAVEGKQRTVLLRFDTAERLLYERDSPNVLQDCEVEELDAPSWEWLLRRIGLLPNTFVLIAARPIPDDELLSKLKDAYRDRLLHLKLGGFELLDTTVYFRTSGFGQQVAEETPEMVDKVHLLSGGRPILIALALDWLKRGMWDPRLYPMAVAELRQLRTQFESQRLDASERAAWEDIQRRFESALVGQIRDLSTPLDIAVRYVALCRKGCNVALLRHLMQAGGHEVGQEEAEHLVVQLLELSFVKPPRPGSRDMFFLHDEMYDLVERYVWLRDWPHYHEQARLDRVIIDWYTEQIEVYARRIREARDWQERGQLRREQQLLIAERVYYQFDADPRLGYREYSHLVEETIAQRELEWDTWLHNEALWFMSHRAWRRGEPNDETPDYPRRDPAWRKDGISVRNPTVDYDSRRHWVSRYIARNQLSNAVRIAEKLLDMLSLPGEPELYRPGLRIALAAAQSYLSGEHIDAAVTNFEAGLNALSAVPVEHREPWLHPYLSGSAHLYRGLALRGKLSLDQAREAYSQAIRYFRQINYAPGLAEAANNLAYILARQGRLEPALSTGNEALRIRQALGDEYGIGLSLNTVGIIHERMAHPITAIARSEQALDIFTKIGNARGIMLARINLGRAYRRKARSPEWEQQDKDFEQGERCLKEAIESGQDADVDKFYQVEAYNELGCLYRDWVATLRERKEQNGQIRRLLDLAETHLNHAVDLTDSNDAEGMPHVVQHVDSLEDLARLHYWRARFDMPCQEGDPVAVMTGQLDRAEDLAQRYVKSREELKLILGKIYLQRARLARLQQCPVVEIGKHYGLAAGFTESYSLDAPEAHKFAGDACDWLGELNPSEAEQAISVMRDVLLAENLRSTRLRDSIENVVGPLLGIGWPMDEETSNG